MHRTASIMPLRIAEREPRQLAPAEPEVCVFETGTIGFLGAADEDRRRWLLGFRRVLDSLDFPMQVVLRFVPGGGARPQPIRAQDMDLLPASAERRTADLKFASQLDERRSAQRREVLFVAATKAADRLESALKEMGVPQLRRTSPVTNDATFGAESARMFIDASGRLNATWYLARFPGVELEAGWLQRLIPPGVDATLSWHAEPLPSGWVVDFLQRQLAHMRASRMEQLAGAAVDPALEGAMPSAERLQRSLTSSEEKAFHVSLYITVSAHDRASLDEASHELVGRARSSLCELRPCSFRMVKGRLCTLPLAVDTLRHQHVLDTSSAVTLFPWADPELRHSTGIVVGRSAATERAVLLDPFDQTRYANANIGVFGHSGAGKTYLLSTLAMGALSSGAQVFVMDPEHEYGGLAARLDGVDIRLALGSGHAINVLGLRLDPNRDETTLGPAVADAVDLTSVICGDLDESERAVMEAAVREAYAEVEEPVLRDVSERLPRESRAARILRRWSNGSLGAMFSAPTNVDLDAPIVVFGMRELREELIAPVHFLLAEALWRRIKQKGRRRLLVIDELGLLFEDPTIRRFVVRLARRIRKYDGSLVFATQNQGDLLSSEAGAVVATNPAIHFFGAQRPGEAAKLQTLFHLSDQQRTLLETARRGEFLLSAGPERLGVVVEAPPWQAQLMKAGTEPVASL